MLLKSLQRSGLAPMHQQLDKKSEVLERFWTSEKKSDTRSVDLKFLKSSEKFWYQKIFRNSELFRSSEFKSEFFRSSDLWSDYFQMFRFFVKLLMWSSTTPVHLCPSTWYFSCQCDLRWSWHDRLSFMPDQFSVGLLVSIHGGRCWLGCIKLRSYVLSTYGRWTCIQFRWSRWCPLGMSYYTTVFVWSTTPGWHRYLSLCARCLKLALLLCQPVCVLSPQQTSDHINGTYLVLSTMTWSCDTTGA